MTQNNSETGIRLAKAIAAAGISSRRDAEKLIEHGKVIVDGIKIMTPVFFVNNNNAIEVNGVLLNQNSNKKPLIWKFYKPKGVITSKDDTKDRKTVYNFIDIKDQRLIYIGRLDYNTEGLLLFTNNGAIARQCTLPSTGLIRKYKVRIFGTLSDEQINALNNGININGIQYGKAKIELNYSKNNRISKNTWISISISEGKNREIRKMMEFCGCTVSKLIRTNYGPFSLDNMQVGEFQLASKQEMSNLHSICMFL